MIRLAMVAAAAAAVAAAAEEAAAVANRAKDLICYGFLPIYAAGLS